MAIQDTDLIMIEQNHRGHFAFLPEKLGFHVDEISGVDIIYCGLGTSMFNIAYGVPAKNSIIEDVILNVQGAFKGQPFAWWLPPSYHNPRLTAALLGTGFVLETAEHAMICRPAQVGPLEQMTDLCIKPVINGVLLQDFIAVLEPYDPSARTFYESVQNEDLDGKERLFVGYVAGKPVTIAILFISGSSAGIFSLLTKDEAQGRGYGTDMMRFLLMMAGRSNCQYVTLSASSSSGYRIYERLGFRRAGSFECFEYKGG